MARYDVSDMSNEEIRLAQKSLDQSYEAKKVKIQRLYDEMMQDDADYRELDEELKKRKVK